MSEQPEVSTKPEAESNNSPIENTEKPKSILQQIKPPSLSTLADSAQNAIAEGKANVAIDKSQQVIHSIVTSVFAGCRLLILQQHLSTRQSCRRQIIVLRSITAVILGFLIVSLLISFSWEALLECIVMTMASIIAFRAVKHFHGDHKVKTDKHTAQHLEDTSNDILL